MRIAMSLPWFRAGFSEMWLAGCPCERMRVLELPMLRGLHDDVDAAPLTVDLRVNDLKLNG